MSTASIFGFTISPFARALAEFDPSVRVDDLIQFRAVPPPHDPLNFVVIFFHNTTGRYLAYDLMTNTWSDVTDLRDWGVPRLIYPSHDPFDHVTSRLR
jgi:hypothetical protein